MSENVVEALVKEIGRNRELLRLYKAIPTGSFGATMIERDINNAVSALASGDAVEILQAYEAMIDNE